MKIYKPKPTKAETVQKKLLSEIIDEINLMDDKNYEPDVASKSAMQIRDLLLKDARLKASARNNALDDFK